MDPMPRYYAAHSPFTDPGPHARLYEGLPQDIPGLSRAVLGLIAHYRASGVEFPPHRLPEIDTRWVGKMLEHIQARDPSPLGEARPVEERLLGCCRDHALLLVSVLRERGVPARTRVGFAPYILEGFNIDHVVAEYWDGGRWVTVDPEMPVDYVPFDPYDMPPGAFLSASTAWRMIREEGADPQKFGVYMASPYRGDGFVRNYVIGELAHLNKRELLLWDWWGPMSERLEGDLGLIDRAAGVMRADAFGSVRDLYASNPELQVPDAVRCLSPTGREHTAAIR